MRRPILLKPFFSDFDKTNNGHVFLNQAKQAFFHAKIALSDSDFLSLASYFAAWDGFDYIAFLQALEAYKGFHLLMLENHHQRFK